ncbi:MAG: tyrosine-type recombinase/integrase [Bryobacteraceae bacterium]|jgi:integrase
MLSEAVNRHIELYRSMGFKYKVQAYMLHSFADFAQGRSEEFVHTDSVLEWAASAPSVRQRHDRLLTVRRLACALNAEDKRHQVPPADFFGRARKSRRTCHIFTPDEIDRLLRAASHLPPTGSMRPVTYTALLSLIVCTGLRVSEALKLELSDLTEDGLLIRATKFQKNRLVPLHESARCELQRYVAARSRVATTTATVFISQRGARLPYPTVNATYLRLARSAGLRGGPGLGGCRIQDLRHTFAVRSLEQCAGDRKAVARHMAALSTYLGHAHVSDTYWYLQATPKLLGDVATAAEALHQGGER